MAAARGLAWDTEAVEDITAYFSGLRHIKGEWAGQPIRLEDWQVFVLGSIVGWKWAATGLRRFRTVYAEIPRKNSKSTMGAGFGNYLAFDDGEGGAEVYAASTKRDQSMIVWGDARQMVLKSPALRRKIRVMVGNLHDPETASKFEPLGADADNLDGLNVHAAIVDELHAHKTRALWDVLETATGARRQSLIFAITTAGSNLASVCYDQRAYAEKVLDGIIDDDRFLAIIYTIDPDDAWDDPAAWAKANPNLGISVKLDDLAMLAQRAHAMPAAKSVFLAKRLNVWNQSEDPWIPPEQWARCGEALDLASFDGADALLSLDLASKSDLAAAVLMFRRDQPTGEDGDLKPHYYVTARFYLPEDLVRARAHDATAHYAGWAEQGWLTLTPGNVIDFRYIMADIRGFARRFNLREIPHDPNQAAMLSTELGDEGLLMVEVQQSAKALSGPMRDAMTLVEEGRIHHDRNPILAWNVSNVRIKYVGGDEKRMIPKKLTRGLKIDGAACLIMALSRAMVLPPRAERVSSWV